MKPGSLVALAYCAAQNLLPGYLLLESMLNAAPAQAEPFVQEQRPELHRLRALDWLRDVGLVELSSETAAHTVQAPLDAGVRQALVGLLQWRLGSDPVSSLSEEHAEMYQHLCVATSPEFILD